MGLQDLKMQIVESLKVKPATINELMKREFLHYRARYGIEILLNILIEEGKIYIRSEKYYFNKRCREV